MVIWGTHLHKEGAFYRGIPKEWEMELYGFYPRGLGDLIYNTLRKILEDNDLSAWALDSYEVCEKLLEHGLRWPTNLTYELSDRIARNRIDWEWSKLLYKLGVQKTVKYRHQRSMTRDPWILYYCCTIHFNKPIQLCRFPQWWLYRPKIWEWIKALQGKNNCYSFFLRILPYPKKDFVIVLEDYMRKYYYASAT